MANARVVDDDFLGAFNSVAELERRYPAALRSGIQATVTSGSADYPYVSDGVSWKPSASYSLDSQGNVTGLVGPSGVITLGLDYDVVIYGANPGGIMTAISASRMGARCLLIAERSQIGGMVTGGICHTDVQYQMDKALIKGLANKYYTRLQKNMQAAGMQSWLNVGSYYTTPRQARQTLLEMLNETKTVVSFNETAVSAAKTGTRITSLTTTKRTVTAAVFIDATYTGDLLALCGITTTIGRESAAQYSEAHGGIVSSTGSNQFAASIDPYVSAGVPGSGLLPGIWATDAQGNVTTAGGTGLTPVAFGTTGAASPYVQAATFRLFLTTNSTFRVAIPDPTTYNALNYELLGRHLASVGGAFTTLSQVVQLYQLSTNQYWDTNTNMPLGFDFVDPQSTEYITATSARRLQIEENAKQYILGVWKFLKTDSRVTAAVKADMANYGFDSREYVGNGNFPDCFYVRCGRRMVGDTVTTENTISLDITSNAQTVTNPIACSYYWVDSHDVRRVVNGGFVVNEGGFFTFPGSTAAWGSWIPQSILMPKVAECTNVMATFAVSASYAAFDAVRLEPISMQFGEAAGIIAAWSAYTNGNVQSCPNAEVLRVMDFYGDQVPANGAIMSVDGTTYTQGTLTTTGSWTTATFPRGTVKMKHAATSAAGASQKFAPNLIEAGVFDVYINYFVHFSNVRSTVTPITIVHGAGTTNITVDQNQGGQSGDWLYIGSYTMAKGSPSAHYVQVGTDGTNSSVIAGVKFIPKAP